VRHPVYVDFSPSDKQAIFLLNLPGTLCDEPYH